MQVVRYAAGDWGVGELWLDGEVPVWHELPVPALAIFAQRSHGVEAFDGLQGAQQDGDGLPGLARDHVQAVMHAVHEVDVGRARRAVHGLVPR